MIAEPGGPRGCPPLPSAVVTPLPESTNHPAEVVTVQGEVGHRLVHAPILTEPVRLPRLPRVVTAVRTVLAFHERGVDRPAHRRRRQGLPQAALGPEDQAPRDGDHAVVLP